MTSTLIANLVFSPPFPANSDSLDPFSSFFHPLQLVKDKRVWAVALVWVVSNSLLAAKFRNYAGIDKTRSLSWSSILGWPVRVQFAIHTEWLTGQMTHREAKSSKNCLMDTLSESLLWSRLAWASPPFLHAQAKDLQAHWGAGKVGIAEQIQEKRLEELLDEVWGAGKLMKYPVLHMKFL